MRSILLINNMKAFEILDHPADIGIKVYGKNLVELFSNAAVGTSSLIINLGNVSADETKQINIQGKNQEDLFIRWLDEIIYLFDSEGFLTKNVIVETLHAISLQATLKGEKFNKDRHEIKLYLKAVTYHQLEIRQTKKGWRAKVFFDV